MNKEDLREKLKKIRMALSKEEVLEKSLSIERRIFSLEVFKDSKVILFYVSYNNEVFTHNMIKKCLGKKDVVVPVSNTKNETIILSRLLSWNDLERGSYGILEPKKIIEVSPRDLDLAIVPGLGFDKKGNRLGHGKGYYDNLLKDIKSLKIALAFECQIVEKIPVEKHDIRVDKIITEKRIINCYRF